MEVSKDTGSSVRRPKNNLRLYYALSFVIAALTTIVTALGLLSQGTTYPSEALRKSFVPTDVVILFIGLPIGIRDWSAEIDDPAVADCSECSSGPERCSS